MRALGGAVTAALAAVLIAGCTGGDPNPTGGGGSAGATASSTAAAATRWWSNSAAGVGSVIDLDHPTALAKKLHASQADYCAMLRDTVRAGRSVLGGLTAQDPALIASTEAFLAEVQGVAPTPVAASWKVLGRAVQALVAAHGDATKVTGVDTAAVRRAGVAISAHAKGTCRVDVSAATP